MNEKLKILFVDDEITLLESLRRATRSMRKEWDCEFVSSGKEALRILSDKPFDLVVSDMRMPEMNGAQFLRKVKKQNPNTMRFILSGQTEDKAFFQSIGAMHQFLSKPCDFNFLKGTINRGLSLRRSLHNDKIKKLLLKIDSLPSMPELYCELMEELQSDNSTLENVGNIISKDIGMTIKILQVANSAFFGSPNSVSTPVHAVQVLGLELIQSLVLGCQIFSKLNLSNKNELLTGKIWKHSINVAELAMALAKVEKVKCDIENYSFTAGLLHEIGKMIVLVNLPEMYQEYLLKLEADNRNELEIEKEVFGSSCSQVGAYLISLWGLPDPIVEAIAYHETPSKCISKSPSALTFVHVANVLVQGSVEGYIQEIPDKLDQKYLEEIGMLDRFSKWKKILMEFDLENGG